MSVEEEKQSSTETRAEIGPSPPYCVFSHKKLITVLIITSLSGMLSPLTANIYFPAILNIQQVNRSEIALVVVAPRSSKSFSLSPFLLLWIFFSFSPLSFTFRICTQRMNG